MSPKRIEIIIGDPTSKWGDPNDFDFIITLWKLCTFMEFVCLSIYCYYNMNISNIWHTDDIKKWGWQIPPLSDAPACTTVVDIVAKIIFYGGEQRSSADWVFNFSQYLRR